MILTGLGGGGAGEVVPRGTYVRKRGGWAGQTLREIGLKKHRGENSALLNQRAPARDWPGHCRAGADQRRGSEPPMCAPPGTPFARGGQPGGGGADLCVRSAGIGSEEMRSDGQLKDLDRKARCARDCENHSKGAGSRVAGGRTSVSAPLGLDRKRIVRWATQRRGSANNHFPASCHLPPSSWKHHPAQACSPGTFFHGSWNGFGGGRTWLLPRCFAIDCGWGSDPGSLAAHWDAGFRLDIQRSGHRGPPPRDPGAGPF